MRADIDILLTDCPIARIFVNTDVQVSTDQEVWHPNIQYSYMALTKQQYYEQVECHINDVPVILQKIIGKYKITQISPFGIRPVSRLTPEQCAFLASELAHVLENVAVHEIYVDDCYTDNPNSPKLPNFLLYDCCSVLTLVKHTINSPLCMAHVLNQTRSPIVYVIDPLLDTYHTIRRLPEYQSKMYTVLSTHKNEHILRIYVIGEMRDVVLYGSSRQTNANYNRLSLAARCVLAISYSFRHVTFLHARVLTVTFST